LFAQQQEQAQKQVKDENEFRLFTSVTKENDWGKKLPLIEQWKKEYPDSAYKEERQLMIVVAYQNLRQGEKMWEAAKELVTINPKSLPGWFYLTSLALSLKNPATDRLEIGEKAARTLMPLLEEAYAPAKRPPNVQEKDFENEKNSSKLIAFKTLGWIEMTRKNYEKAEQEFVAFLKQKPNSGEVTYWLATVILQQKRKERQLETLYHLMRAAHYKGEEELPEATRNQLQGLVKKNYITYTGLEEGLAKMVELALSSPFPPEGWTLESEQQRLARKRVEISQTDPQLFAWLQLKDGLTEPTTRDKNWEELKGSALPKLKGKVISTEPPHRPKEILVGITNSANAEVKLKLDTALPNKAEPGTEIEFEGVAAEFAPDPFLVTLDQERAKVTGWPAAPKPSRPVSKKAGSKRSAKGSV